MEPMTLTSPAFEDGGDISSRYTCDGDNISPPLQVVNVPPGAKALALIAEDPDAPGGTWVHWTVWNINPHQGEIAEGTVPREAVIGRNDFHKNSYGGPCPPGGVHRYLFRLFALDQALDLAGGADRASLERAMEQHLMAEATLTGKYGSA